MKKYIFYTGLFLLTLFISILLINFYVLSFSKQDYYKNIDLLENKEVWIVFWASIISNNKPSDILKDRLIVAYNAYINWKIKKIIVSWDNSSLDYNEPQVMKNYLISLWVNSNDIYMDHAWFDTYSTLYRARDVFNLKEVVLFTQDFHLKRAMYLSRRLWIKSYWVETNLNNYISDNYNNKREILARIKAFIDVEILKTKPKFLWEEINILTDEMLKSAKKEIFLK